MSAIKSEETPLNLQKMLDISIIDDKSLQTQLEKIQDELNEVKSQLEQKNKLCDIYKKSKDALEEQTKAVKIRQQERIKSLQAQLEKLRAQNAKYQESRAYIVFVQKNLQVQRQRNLELVSMNQNLNSEISKLKKNLLNQDQPNSSQSIAKNTQLHQKILQLSEQRNQILTERALLLQKNEQLTLKLQKETQKQVVEESQKIGKESKEAENMLQEQKSLSNMQSKKLKQQFENQIKPLKNKLEYVLQENYQLKSSICELKNLYAENQINQSKFFDGSTSFDSAIERNKKGDIDDERFDENLSLMVKSPHKRQIDLLNTYFNSIGPEHKICFLNLISGWSETIYERIQVSLNELTQY